MVINKKIVSIIFIFALIGTILLITFTGYEVIKTLRYEKINAEVVNAYTRSGTGTSRSKAHYIVYEFMVNGKKYNATKQVFNDAINRIGKTEVVRYNPQNPEELQNTYKIYAGFFVIVFLVLFELVLFLSLRRKS